MIYKIECHQPKKTYRYLMAFWCFLLLLVVFLILIQEISPSFFPMLLLFLLITGLAYWHLRQFKESWNQSRVLYCSQHEWAIESAGEKTAIELVSGTRAWKYWVLLKYKRLHSNKKYSNKKYSLFLPKDAVSDENFRHLSRTLNYFSEETIK